jgi:hypothetical protein
MENEMKTRPMTARLALALAMLAVVAVFGSACGGAPTEPTDTEQTNRNPVINSLSGNPSSIVTGDISRITCAASDPDGDQLSYNWSATGGSITGTAEIVNWTAPGTAGTYSISATVTDGRGGTAIESYTITVTAVTTDTENRPPVIVNISATPESVEPQKGSTLTCEATDPDGDPLSYEWWSKHGRIEGTGKTVTWMAPPELGRYEIEIIVRDNRYGNAVGTCTVNVTVNKPPEITDIRAQPAVILIEQNSTITCEAQDPEGKPLTYNWSSPEGSLSGSGNSVTWTAPGRSGNFTIEVQVEDDRGDTDSASITVRVDGVKITTTPKPLDTESGAIRSDEELVSQWTVGDDQVNKALRTYLSFDISNINEADIIEFGSAILTISTVDKNGTPWTDLGLLIIDRVEYGARALQVTDYYLPGTRLASFDAAPTTEIDLTTLIRQAINDGDQRFQIRVYFETATDNDSTSDNIRVSSAEIEISYIAPTL